MTRSNPETAIGLETFFTKTKGIEGKLRTRPEDFVVNEVFLHPEKTEKGTFSIAEVTARNWETNLLVRALAKKLFISRNRIGFAGTKDKRACSTQLMSFAQVPPDVLSQIALNDVLIDHIYPSDRPVAIGDLVGNRFDITVRAIDKQVKKDQVQMLISEILDAGGFPNFFGVQRFGIIRPVNHLIGHDLVNGDIEQAVMRYIAYPLESESKETYQLRKQLQETYNFTEALQSYPDILSYEKAILNRLVVQPHDFTNALAALPKNLLTMFIYAYQSYLFNRILSERIRRGLPLNTALIGDIVLPVKDNKVNEEEHILVTKTNSEKVNKQMKKGKAVVSGLLVGYDIQFSEGAMGEIEHTIIEQEHLNLQNFIIPELPFISSSGTRRSLLAPLQTIDWKLTTDEIYTDKHAIHVQFELRKGCYATSLLREFMKSSDIRSY